MSDEPLAAVAILRAKEPEDSVLLIRRATNPLDSWSGHWSFPGGRRSDSDTDLLDTALRELAEECGIWLRREDLSETLPISHAGSRLGKLVHVQPYVFSIPAIMPAELDLSEAAEAFWMPTATIFDMALHQKTAVPGLPESMLFPNIALHGAPLWGFTYRVLCEWLGIPIQE